MLRRLGDRPHGDEVEVHVAGCVERVADHIRDVVGHERRLNTRVHGVDEGLIAAEAIEGELRGVDHSRRDLHHTKRFTVQFQSERVHQHALGSLRGVVSTTARVRRLGGG